MTEGHRKPIRVLMQNRPTALSQRGGDTVLMEKTTEGLTKLGVEVVIDLEGTQNPADFNLVHLFNFATPDLTRQQAERAVQAGVPFVVTTLCEDVEKFHNQSWAVASNIVEYVANGQTGEWWAANRFDLSAVPAAQAFDNQWTATHAAALLPNGSEEAKVLRRLYGNDISISEVPLGYDIGIEGDPELFIKEYGLNDFILCVGRLESRKNQLMLLKALEDSELDVVLAAGGFSYQPEYEEAVRKFQRKGRTLVLGRLSDEMLASAYAAARVHALPSWYELPGLVSLEAAHYGCNVVATEMGTSRDYMKDKAFYCRPDDENSILNAVVAAYHSPVSEGLRDLARATSWETTAMETFKTYSKVTGVETSSEPALAATGSSMPHGGYDMAPDVNEFQELLDRGEIAARERDFDTAIHYLGRAEALNARSLRTLRAIGAVMLAQGMTKEAFAYFRRAEEVDPGDAKTLRGIGMCYMSHQESEKAYSCFVRAIEIDSTDDIAILQLMEAAYVIERFDDLTRVLTKFVHENPESTDMRFCLAGALFKSGEVESARVQNQRVLNEQPLHDGAKQLEELINGGSVSAVAAQTPTPEAAATPEPAVTIPEPSVTMPEPAVAAPVETAIVEKTEDMSAPEWNVQPVANAQADIVTPAVPASEAVDMDSFLSELEYYKRDRDYERVKEGCAQVINTPTATQKQQEIAVILRAEVAVLEQELEAAAEAYNEILRINPDSARAHTGKATIEASTGNWEGAKEGFEKSMQLDPAYDVPYAGMGLYYTMTQDLDKAWDCFHAALSRNPENRRALLGIIEVGFAGERYSEVEEQVKKFLDARPADLDFIYSLAGCYYAQSKFDAALAELNKILIFKPNHEKALEMKSKIEQTAQPAPTMMP